MLTNSSLIVPEKLPGHIIEGKSNRTGMAKAWLALDRSIILPYCHHLSTNQWVIVPSKKDKVK
jgi:hypothetical protein